MSQSEGAEGQPWTCDPPGGLQWLGQAGRIGDSPQDTQAVSSPAVPSTLPGDPTAQGATQCPRQGHLSFPGAWF